MLDQFVLESEWYNIILERGTKEGMEKGLEKGKAQGIEEGKAQGIEEGEHMTSLRLARRSLEKRFGTLSEDVMVALDSAEEAALEEIVLNPDEDLAQVRARLGI